MVRSKTICRHQFVGKPICRQANLAASQFGGKINKNDLPSLALKRRKKVLLFHKGNCKCSADKSENFNLKLLNALNLAMLLAQYYLFKFTIA